ncbi:MAG: hypothetical protein FWG14_04935 [Peptococcaceae bacterium]|nr:hypothetical protein [Peptococcaceae bacterium]
MKLIGSTVEQQFREQLLLSWEDSILLAGAVLMYRGVLCHPVLASCNFLPSF